MAIQKMEEFVPQSPAGPILSGFPAILDGAGNRIRTDDLRITNALLYQLSYPGKPLKKGKSKHSSPPPPVKKLIERSTLASSLGRPPRPARRPPLRALPGSRSRGLATKFREKSGVTWKKSLTK